MRRVKIFKRDEDEVQLLEKDVNQWIEESRADVISISGNIAPQTERLEQRVDGGEAAAAVYPPSDVLLVVLYESGGSA